MALHRQVRPQTQQQKRYCAAAEKQRNKDGGRGPPSLINGRKGVRNYILFARPRRTAVQRGRDRARLCRPDTIAIPGSRHVTF
eukprot:292516-Pleurochrysis_carterae.AAC.1